MTKSSTTKKKWRESRNCENFFLQNRRVVDEMSEGAQVLRIKQRDSESRLFRRLVSISRTEKGFKTHCSFDSERLDLLEELLTERLLP